MELPCHWLLPTDHRQFTTSMADQAEKLRQMIVEEAPVAPNSAPAPPMIVVTGGKGGVGTTTVSMNLAAALSDGGQRVVLVDAARHHADLAELAGIPFCSGGTLTDVLVGKTSAIDALVPGPAGTLLLAERWGAKPHCDYSRVAQQRMLNELASLGDVSDVLVVDAGSGVSQWIQELWKSARFIIIVATCDDLAVMDAYATIKLGSVAAANAELHLVLNQCDNDRQAAEVERRLETACRRFLGRAVSALPSLPSHVPHDIESGRECAPRVWEVSNTNFGHAVLWLGSAVCDLFERPPETSSRTASRQHCIAAQNRLTI